MTSVYSLVLAREGLVIGMPSPIIKIAKIIKQTPPESCWYGGHPRIRLAMACDWLWRGSKLYFSAWEPPLMCLAWKILKTLGRDIDRKGIPPKILFISDLSFELCHLCKSMLPSAKGLSIYFYVILLLLLSHHLLK